MKSATFTRIPLKAQIYEREVYFREGLADAIAVLADDAVEAIRKAALLIVKPDGLATGKIATVLDFLRANDFSIAAVEPTTITRFHWRELWRYQLTSATLDRLAVNDLVLRDRALLLLLRSDRALDLPASVFLSKRKGPSDVSAQSHDCLRRLLAQPNRIFSFIHVADEPADILRELAILLDGPERRRVFSSLSRHTISRAEQDLLDKVLAASESTAKTVDVEGSLMRVEQAMRGVSVEDAVASAASQQVLADLARMRVGERISWLSFAQALAATGQVIERWDAAALGATFIVYDEPGTSKLITAVDPELWRDQ